MALSLKTMSGSVLASVTFVFVKIYFGSGSPVTPAFLLVPNGYWSLLSRPMTEYFALARTLFFILNVFIFQ